MLCLFSYFRQVPFCYIFINSTLRTVNSKACDILEFRCVDYCTFSNELCYISVDSTLRAVNSTACDIWELRCVYSRTFNKDISVTFLWILLFRLTFQPHLICKNSAVFILVVSTRTFQLHFYGLYFSDSLFKSAWRLRIPLCLFSYFGQSCSVTFLCILCFRLAIQDRKIFENSAVFVLVLLHFYDSTLLCCIFIHCTFPADYQEHVIFEN